ncbi:uncharacterized protein METZ01_LOCUS431337, partial [marine metagenome]
VILSSTNLAISNLPILETAKAPDLGGGLSNFKSAP